MITRTILRMGWVVVAIWPGAALADEALDKAVAEARSLLTELVKIDTSNPPGNELLAARFLEPKIRASRVEVFETGEGRGNLIARIPATGVAVGPPVVLVAHLDTVGADPAQWATNPFELVEEGRYLRGRGVIDDKGMAAAMVASFNWLIDQPFPRSREVILILTADEEAGGEKGTRWLIENEKIDFGATLVINEGGDVRLADPKRVGMVGIQVSEKRFRNLVLRTKAPGGHSSQPLTDNAIVRLGRAVAKVGAVEFPAHVTQVTRRTFRAMAASAKGKKKKDLLALARTKGRPSKSVVARLQKDPAINAQLRTTCTPTLFSAGKRSNALAQSAEATINCRVHPEDTWALVKRTLVSAIGDRQVEFVADEGKLADPSSPTKGKGWDFMVAAAKETWPTAKVEPFMSAGATDSKNFRANGMPSYGLLPFPLTDEDDRRMHGTDEGMPTKSLAQGVKFLTNLLRLATK